jgi:hypothetical protein
MRIDLVQPDGSRRVFLPRKGDGTFIASDDANSHSARNLTGDLLGQVIGLSDDGLAAFIRSIVPVTAAVAETDRHAVALGYDDARRKRIKGSRQGRGIAIADALTGNGRAVSLKLMSSDGHADITLTTPKQDTAAQVVQHLAAYHDAGGDIPVVVVAAENIAPKGEEAHYIIKADRVAWQIAYCYREVRDLAHLLASKRGAGRPKKGTVLPLAWAIAKETDCTNDSYQIRARVKSLGEKGWTFGTVGDLRNAVNSL